MFELPPLTFPPPSTPVIRSNYLQSFSPPPVLPPISSIPSPNPYSTPSLITPSIPYSTTPSDPSPSIPPAPATPQPRTAIDIVDSTASTKKSVEKAPVRARKRVQKSTPKPRKKPETIRQRRRRLAEEVVEAEASASLDIGCVVDRATRADKGVLYGTRYLGIQYGGGDGCTRAFSCASDAAYADDPETRRSTEGYVFHPFGGPIDWKPSKQKTVTTSSTEAEILALSHAAKDLYCSVLEVVTVFCLEDFQSIGPPNR
jgi:hypothetical protein